MAADNTLSLREIRFAQFLVEGDTLYESWEKAGFPVKRERQTIDSNAWRLARKPQIQAYIQQLKRDASDAAQVTIDALAAEFKSATQADIAQCLDEDGNWLPVKKWPWSVRRHIVGIEPAKGGGYKVRFENRTECRKLLAQWIGMIGDKEGGEVAGAAGNQKVLVIECGESVQAPSVVETEASKPEGEKS